MNKIYRLIWNETTATWTAASESARGRGKRSSKATAGRSVGSAALAAPPTPTPPAPAQLPTGGRVVAGTAAISQAAVSNGAVMTVTQSTQRAAIDWQTFNVGAAARVNFVQPSASSVTLNRVLDANPSQIFGRISANGQVFLTNPNGVYFSPSASVDVGGFLATTHGISTADFMAGRSSFTRNGASGSILNEGNLNAGLGGYIALLAPEVRNSGVIVAQLGTVALAAGEAYDLQFEGDRLAGMRVTPATIAALVDNGNAVHAPGGLIILSAQAANALQGGVINNTGTLEATGLTSHGGTIRLEASDRIAHSGAIRADGAAASAGKGGTVTLIADLANPASRTEVSGSISARGGDLGGDGGFIETSATTVNIADSARISTAALRGRAGTWLIDPTDDIIAASGGNITGTSLSASLTGGNVEILSSSGTSGTGGDINVNDSVSWSANTLTLTAARDININAVMTASGASALTLNTATANGGAGAVSGGTVKVGLGAGGFSGRVDFPGRSGTGFLTINGDAYTVINGLGAAGDESVGGNTLQGLGHSSNLAGKFALGANINVADTSGWNPVGGVNQGFSPIGTPDFGTRFSGTLDGLGHVISGLTINRATTDNVGLIGVLDTGGVLRNLGGSGGSVSGNALVGGLVGFNWGTIGNSYATGNVSGNFNAGGLVGGNSVGTISNSYATGAVTGGDGLGGLVGSTILGTISNSYATGAVSGSNVLGGLVGDNTGGTISASYATGAVNGTGNGVGGLAGINNMAGTISSSYATGAVTGYDNVGGLVGGNTSQISESYATGAVTGHDNVGGLVGMNAGAISTTYATGRVTGTTTPQLQVGGLVGFNDFGTVADSSWNTETTGQANSSGGGRGLNNDGMANPANFADWNSGTWSISVGQTRPLLAAFTAQQQGYQNSPTTPPLSDLTDTSVTFGAPEFRQATSSASDGRITYTSSNPAVATVDSDGDVTVVGAGCATITATQAASGNYSAPAADSYTLTVGKATPTLTDLTATSTTYGAVARGPQCTAREWGRDHLSQQRHQRGYGRPLQWSRAGRRRRWRNEECQPGGNGQLQRTHKRDLRVDRCEGHPRSTLANRVSYQGQRRLRILISFHQHGRWTQPASSAATWPSRRLAARAW